jgi:molybdopterin-containing oxidoreductase family iron-sulfur binding subunit
VTGFSDAETVLTISHSSLAALAGSTQDYVNGSGTELRIVPDNKILDGSYAGNGWLQEMPDPITKLTWDNALCISPNDAKAQGVDTGEIVELAAGSNSVRVAVLVSPLQADGSMSLAMGYGQHGNLTSAQYKKLASIDPNYSGIPARDLAQGIGVNACVLQNAPAEFIVANVSIKRTGKKHQLALTQDPYFIDKLGKREREKRAFVQIRSTTLDFFKHNPDFVSYYDHHVKLKSLWTEHDYSEHKWALAIDLNRCIGCGSCLVACQSENNVPVVGRRRILEGREMHWLRLDRYTVEHNGVAFSLAQPLGCQHCELAPCEQVCPVAATTHSSEGLNDMVYNRCIGTRYCANNCPFKVRRFNYFDYRKGITPTEEMQFNPDVTVRSRGVMEKCSFCVQRIQEAKIASKNSDEPIPDGAIQPACAQTCPTKAIAFGDLNDKSSKIAKWNADKRAYVLLRELNIKPRVSYLAKIRNPAPGTPEADYPKPETHGHGTGKKHSSEKEHH